MRRRRRRQQSAVGDLERVGTGRSFVFISREGGFWTCCSTGCTGYMLVVIVSEEEKNPLLNKKASVSARVLDRWGRGGGGQICFNSKAATQCNGLPAHQQPNASSCSLCCACRVAARGTAVAPTRHGPLAAYHGAHLTGSGEVLIVGGCGRARSLISF